MKFIDYFYVWIVGWCAAALFSLIFLAARLNGDAIEWHVIFLPLYIFIAFVFFSVCSPCGRYRGAFRNNEEDKAKLYRDFAGLVYGFILGGLFLAFILTLVHQLYRRDDGFFPVWDVPFALFVAFVALVLIGSVIFIMSASYNLFLCCAGGDPAAAQPYEVPICFGGSFQRSSSGWAGVVYKASLLLFLVLTIVSSIILFNSLVGLRHVHHLDRVLLPLWVGLGLLFISSLILLAVQQGPQSPPSKAHNPIENSFLLILFDIDIILVFIFTVNLLNTQHNHVLVEPWFWLFTPLFIALGLTVIALVLRTWAMQTDAKPTATTGETTTTEKLDSQFRADYSVLDKIAKD